MAQREIEWTTRALSDRTNILEYWYEKTGTVDYPVKLQDLFTATIRLFSKMPEAGKEFDQKRAIRFVIIKHFRIYFTYTDQKFVVLSIWDTRRNR
uniref:type II toxin-antitoxin system RelE/ParE family toxin n=1 Tax=Rhodohalobacter halophilus TaxID=1812810 RepID=UPI00083F57C1